MSLPSSIQTEADFTAIYNAYFDELYAYTLVQIKIEDIAQDIVHDIFLSCWDQRSRININKQLKAYLFRCCHNRVIDFFRQASKNQQLRKKLLQAYDPVNGESSLSCKELLQLDQLAEEALDALPPQRKKVFILCRHQGKTYQQAAEELGISAHTVKEHMSNALSFLRNFIHKRTDLVVFFILLKKYFW